MSASCKCVLWVERRSVFDREVSDENEGKTDIIGLTDSGIEFADQHVGFLQPFCRTL